MPPGNATAIAACRRVLRAARAAAALAGLAALLVACPPAGAVIVQVGGRTLSYQAAPNSGVTPLARTETRGGEPKSAGGSALTYHKGPVMPANTNYVIYWSPSGSSAYPAGYQAGIDRYFEDLAHDSGGLQNTDSILTQYGDSGGHYANYASHFGGGLLDTHPYPANGCSSAPICLTDPQIRSEIQSFVEAAKLPINVEHTYFLLTPEGVESCMEAAGKSCSAGAVHPVYCAYHGYIVAAGGAPLIYAEDPYVEGLGCDVGNEHPNGNASDATIAGGLAHEHAEAVTDPELNAWYDAKGNEVGDKCRTLKAKTEYGPPLGQAPDKADYNQVINGDLYLYQQMWSNQTGECAQRAATLPVVTKVKPKSGPAGGGTTVTITGSGFSGPATVSFGSAQASEVQVLSATTITAVSPAGAPESKVDVTVSTAEGTSAPVKGDLFKYKSH